MIQGVSQETLRIILRESKVIAVAGLSPRENRPSYLVARYMQQAGYCIIPVNPGHEAILGLRCYPDLRSIPHPVDIVDIFRRSDQVGPIVEDAIAIGVKVIWMQRGIVNLEAAKIAEENGLVVIMDRCIKVDHQNVQI